LVEVVVVDKFIQMVQYQIIQFHWGYTPGAVQLPCETLQPCPCHVYMQLFRTLPAPGYCLVTKCLHQSCAYHIAAVLLLAALAVMARGARPDIPAHTPPGLAALIQECWAPVPEQRPGFDVVVLRLQELLQSLQQAEATAAAAAAANATAASFTAQAAATAATYNLAAGMG
jgi:hypothetical protein